MDVRVRRGFERYLGIKPHWATSRDQLKWLLPLTVPVYYHSDANRRFMSVARCNES